MKRIKFVERSNRATGSVIVPAYGIFAADDAVARKRKELAEKLKKGEKIVATPSGKIVAPNSSEAQSEHTIEIPQGKLAYGYQHWYERDPGLFKAEKEAMACFFPGFHLDTLEDGRLCWIGNLAPIDGEGVWKVMAVYDHDHPNNRSTYGTSVKVYSIDPDLEELYQAVSGLPHLLRDADGNLFMCTNRQEDSTDGSAVVTTAASTLAWAVKWIAAITLWLNGDLDDDTMRRHDSNGV